MFHRREFTLAATWKDGNYFTKPQEKVFCELESTYVTARR